MWQARKGRLADAQRGFYFILHSEDRALVRLTPVRWINPLRSRARSKHLAGVERTDTTD